MHGTFENVQRAPSNDLEGYQTKGSSRASSSEPPKNKFRYALLAVPVLLIIAGVAYTSTSKPLISNNTSAESSLSSGDPFAVPKAAKMVTTPVGQISIVASNEYGVYDTSAYPFFDEFPGSQLVEPYKETLITLKGKAVESGKYTFVWSLDGATAFKTGNKATIKLTKAGLFTLSVHAFDSEGVYQSTYETTLISKYVKREIRQMNTDDRERFLDAAFKIWSVSTDAGRELYGNKFTGIHTFVKEHATASEDIMCDQFHEGSGFLTHHLALSNSFEAALRAVDPSVTLPYWDFSIDGQIIEDAGKNPSYLLEISPVFTDKWFGAVDNANHIKNSRWAHIAMPGIGHDDVDTTPHNSYGYFRSYWNNNNDPEVVRHMFDVCGEEDTQKTIPSCKTHFVVMNTTKLAQFQSWSPADGHGPLHVQSGGVFGGCTDAYKTFEAKWSAYLDTDVTEAEMLKGGYTVTQFQNKWGATGQRRTMFRKAIMGEYFHIYRSLWRSHMCALDGSSALLECPESCDASSEFETCTCSVNKLKTGETTWQNMYHCLLNSEENRGYFSAAFSEEFLQETVHFVSTSSVKEGEMLHSGSPADIMFWIIHPVIERMLAAKRVTTTNMMGSTQFYKWPASMSADSSNWLEYSFYNLEAGANKFHQEAYTCKGHAAEDWALPDKLPFSEAMLKSADTNGDGHVTNWEFYQGLDPNNVHGNDYVFDNFKWDHCEGKI